MCGASEKKPVKRQWRLQELFGSFPTACKQWHPDTQKLASVSSILGGYYGSVLMERGHIGTGLIRGKKSLLPWSKKIELTSISKDGMADFLHTVFPHLEHLHFFLSILRPGDIFHKQCFYLCVFSFL